ncbi:hypothetical protein HDU76_005797 [Blyttiomyces sp. JEL0837]|nr:hypothetical protein HDU76_005797 [Blyttiomyces sp. JEL0837]
MNEGQRRSSRPKTKAPSLGRTGSKESSGGFWKDQQFPDVIAEHNAPILCGKDGQPRPYLTLLARNLFHRATLAWIKEVTGDKNPHELAIKYCDQDDAEQYRIAKCHYISPKTGKVKILEGCEALGKALVEHIHGTLDLTIICKNPAPYYQPFEIMSFVEEVDAPPNDPRKIRKLVRATQKIPLGTIIGMYEGRVELEQEPYVLDAEKLSEFDQLIGDDVLKEVGTLNTVTIEDGQTYLRSNVLIDGHRNCGMYAWVTEMNDCRKDPMGSSIKLKEGEECNIKFIELKIMGWSYFFAFAVKDIDYHEELLIDYGENYWSIVKQWKRDDDVIKKLLKPLHDGIPQLLATLPSLVPKMDQLASTVMQASNQVTSILARPSTNRALLNNDAILSWKNSLDQVSGFLSCLTRMMVPVAAAIPQGIETEMEDVLRAVRLLSKEEVVGTGSQSTGLVGTDVLNGMRSLTEMLQSPSSGLITSNDQEKGKEKGKEKERDVGRVSGLSGYPFIRHGTGDEAGKIFLRMPVLTDEGPNFGGVRRKNSRATPPVGLRGTDASSPMTEIFSPLFGQTGEYRQSSTSQEKRQQRSMPRARKAITNGAVFPLLSTPSPDNLLTELDSVGFQVELPTIGNEVKKVMDSVVQQVTGQAVGNVSTSATLGSVSEDELTAFREKQLPKRTKKTRSYDELNSAEPFGPSPVKKLKTAIANQLTSSSPTIPRINQSTSSSSKMPCVNQSTSSSSTMPRVNQPTPSSPTIPRVNQSPSSSSTMPRVPAEVVMRSVVSPKKSGDAEVTLKCRKFGCGKAFTELSELTNHTNNEHSHGREGTSSASISATASQEVPNRHATTKRVEQEAGEQLDIVLLEREILEIYSTISNPNDVTVGAIRKRLSERLGRNLDSDKRVRSKVMDLIKEVAEKFWLQDDKSSVNSGSSSPDPNQIETNATQRKHGSTSAPHLKSLNSTKNPQPAPPLDAKHSSPQPLSVPVSGTSEQQNSAEDLKQEIDTRSTRLNPVGADDIDTRPTTNNDGGAMSSLPSTDRFADAMSELDDEWADDVDDMKVDVNAVQTAPATDPVCATADPITENNHIEGSAMKSGVSEHGLAAAVSGNGEIGGSNVQLERAEKRRKLDEGDVQDVNPGASFSKTTDGSGATNTASGSKRAAIVIGQSGTNVSTSTATNLTPDRPFASSFSIQSAPAVIQEFLSRHASTSMRGESAFNGTHSPSPGLTEMVKAGALKSKSDWKTFMDKHRRHTTSPATPLPIQTPLTSVSNSDGWGLGNLGTIVSNSSVSGAEAASQMDGMLGAGAESQGGQNCENDGLTNEMSQMKGADESLGRNADQNEEVQFDTIKGSEGSPSHGIVIKPTEALAESVVHPVSVSISTGQDEIAEVQCPSVDKPMSQDTTVKSPPTAAAAIIEISDTLPVGSLKSGEALIPPVSLNARPPQSPISIMPSRSAANGYNNSFVGMSTGTAIPTSQPPASSSSSASKKPLNAKPDAAIKLWKGPPASKGDVETIDLTEDDDNCVQRPVKPKKKPRPPREPEVIIELD